MRIAPLAAGVALVLVWPAEAMKVAFVQGALPTIATNTLDLTDSSAGFSNDIKAAICEVAGATAFNTATANALYSLGIAVNDGTPTQLTFGGSTSDGLVTPTVSRDHLTTFNNKVYTLASIAASSSSTGEGTLTFLTDGVRITVDDGDAAYQIGCLLFAGSDIEAKIVTGQYPGTGSNDLTMAHGLGGTPDAAFIFATPDDNNPASGNARFNVGFWGRTIPAEMGMNWYGSEGANPTSNIIENSNTIAIPPNSAFAGPSCDVQTVDSANFTCRGDGTRTDDVAVLLLRGTSSQMEARVLNWTQETATGSDDEISGFTLNIQAGLVIALRQAALNTESASTGVGGASFGMFALRQDATIQQGAVSFSDDDNVTTTDSSSQVSNTEITRVLANGAGAADVEGAITAIDQQVTINTTNAGSSAYQAFGLVLAMDAGAPPAVDFDSGPTVTAVDSNTFRVTYDADANADTIECMARVLGAATPSAADIDAGTGNHGTATEAATGSSDTLDFDVTDSPPFPRYRVDCEPEEGTNNYSPVGSNSSAALTPPSTSGAANNQPCQDIVLSSIDPAGAPVSIATLPYEAQTANWIQGEIITGGTSGAQAVVISDSDSGTTGTLTIGIGSGTFQLERITGDVQGSADVNSSPTFLLAAGDILRAPTYVSPGGSGIALAIGSDGNFSYTSGAERETAFNVSWYDVSGAAYGTPDIDWVNNNVAPTCVGGVLNVVLLTGAAMTTVDLDTMCSPGEGDVMTLAIVSGTQPTGMMHDDMTNEDTGTPSVEDEDGVLITYVVRDPYDAVARKQIQYFPWTSLAAFDCTTDPTTQTDCEAGINAQMLGSVTISTTAVCDSTVAQGEVVSQDPAAGAALGPFTDVDLVVARITPCVQALISQGEL